MTTGSPQRFECSMVAASAGQEFSLACAFLCMVFLSTFPAFADNPRFSWQHIPLYAHLGKVTGDLNPSEIHFLASHYQIATIEKGQALQLRGDTEAGTRVAVAQLEAENPRIKVLAYWNMAIDYDRMYKSLQNAFPNSWFQPTWIIRNERVAWRRFDPSNADFRRWWVNAGVELVKGTGADGLFVDALPQIAAHPAQLAKQVGIEKAFAMITGAKDMLCDLKQALPANSILIVNGLRAMPGGWHNGGMDFMQCVSGAMVEEFAYAQNASPAQIANDLQIIRKAVAMHKMVFVKGWPSPKPIETSQGSAAERQKAHQNLDFPLALFLIAAGEQTYFSYSWGFRADDGWLETYSQFDRTIGPPLSPAKQNGYTYQREYQHASVWTDISKRKARINWH